MSIQAALNDDAISMLPAVKQAIANAEAFESNQMQSKAISEICNLAKPLVDMSEDEKQQFSGELLDMFRHRGWIE
jgi:hypothetical protein